MSADYGYQKLMKRRQEESNSEILRRAGAVGASGAISGGLLGSVGSLLTSGNPKSILKALGVGALGGGALASGANVVGSMVHPGARDDDAAINTKRGGLGGAVVGGLAGSALGASGTIPGAAAESVLGKFASKLKGSKYGGLAGGVLGALAGAGAGAFMGSDEGMQYDSIVNEMKRRGVEI